MPLIIKLNNKNKIDEAINGLQFFTNWRLL